MLILEGMTGEVTRVAFSPDSSAVLACEAPAEGPGRAAVWQLRDGPQPLHLIARASEVLFAPDGASLITLQLNGDQSATLSRHDRATLAVIGHPRRVPPPRHLPTNEVNLFAGPLYAAHESGPALFGLQLTPDGQRLVAVSGHRSLRWWSWPELTPLAVHVGLGTCAPGGVAVAPSNDLLAVFDMLGRACLYAIDRNVPVWETLIYTHQCQARLAYAANGRLVAFASGTAVRVIDAETGEVVARLSQRERHFLDLAFTPDSRFLATVSAEATVKFFDTRSWRVEAEMAWRLGGLSCVAFSNDGMLAAAGSQTGKVVVWDLDL